MSRNLYMYNILCRASQQFENGSRLSGYHVVYDTLKTAVHFLCAHSSGSKMKQNGLGEQKRRMTEGSLGCDSSDSLAFHYFRNILVCYSWLKNVYRLLQSSDADLPLI